MKYKDRINSYIMETINEDNNIKREYENNELFRKVIDKYMQCKSYKEAIQFSVYALYTACYLFGRIINRIKYTVDFKLFDDISKIAKEANEITNNLDSRFNDPKTFE